MRECLRHTNGGLINWRLNASFNRDSFCFDFLRDVSCNKNGFSQLDANNFFCNIRCNVEEARSSLHSAFLLVSCYNTCESYNERLHSFFVKSKLSFATTVINGSEIQADAFNPKDADKYGRISFKILQISYSHGNRGLLGRIALIPN